MNSRICGGHASRMALALIAAFALLPACQKQGGAQGTESSTQPVGWQAGPNDPATLTLVSWNVKHLGRQGLEKEALAAMLTQADLVTFQEVNTKESGQEALRAIATSLRTRNNERICWALSEVPEGAAERYGYLWRDAEVAYVRTDGTVMESCPAGTAAITIRLEKSLAGALARPPGVGTFEWKPKKARFTLATVHLVPSGKKPQREVPPLFRSLATLPGALVVAGDFNLDARHPAFASARAAGLAPAFVGDKTSLKMKKRELSKAYDNIWVRGLRVREKKVLNLYDAFPRLPARAIYDNVSDHSPVQAVLVTD